MAISKINTRALANDSVTTDKVADNAITTDMVASGEIGVTDLADGSITNAKISSTAAIAPSKIDMASVAALTMSGGLTIATGEAGLIATGTSDAADNKRITLAGGGSASWDRGSYLRVAGNESSTGGDLDLVAGNISGADINMYTGGSISATLNNAGNLLVGTTTEGHDNANGITIGGTSGHQGMTIRAPSNSASIIYFSDATTGDGEYDGYLSYNHATRILNVGAAAASRFNVTSTGASVIGNLDLPNVNSYITGQGHNVLQVDATRTYYYGGSNGAQFRTSNNASELLNILDGGEVEIPNSGQFKAASSNATKYVRMYAGGGTGKWDIYGNGANLRITDNQSAGVLAVDTGATFGSNVGVGDSNPSSMLSVSKNSTRTNDVENMLKITHSSSNTTVAGFGSAIYFVGERNNGVNQAMGRLVFDAEVNSGTDISSGFSIQTATAGTTSEKFRITHDGKIGIGQVPAHDLDISNSAANTVKSLRVGGSGSSGTNSGNVLIQAGGSGTSQLRFMYEADIKAQIESPTSSGELAFSANSAEIMRIKSYGDVNIVANAKDWTTIQQGEIRTHTRRFTAGSSASNNQTMLRVRRYYWGGGHFKINLYQTYYSEVTEAVWTLHGYGRNDGSYNPNFSLTNRQLVGTMGASRVTLATPSTSAPGTSANTYVDVLINVPSYLQYVVVIEANCAANVQYNTATNGIGMGNDAYTLM